MPVRAPGTHRWARAARSEQDARVGARSIAGRRLIAGGRARSGARRRWLAGWPPLGRGPWRLRGAERAQAAMRQIRGPGIVLARLPGDRGPFDSRGSICGWAAGLGSSSVQIPTAG